MDHSEGAENDLDTLGKMCEFYKGEAERFPDESLEMCNSIRDDATKMLCDVSAVESNLEDLLTASRDTRTDILRVLKEMDGHIAIKMKREAVKRKRAEKAKAKASEKDGGRPTKKAKATKKSAKKPKPGNEAGK